MPQQLSLLIRAGHSLIAIDTLDEKRAIQTILSAAHEDERPVLAWSMTSGLVPVEAGGFAPLEIDSAQAVAALEHIGRLGPQSAIYIFKDLAPHARDAKLHRTLRDLLPAFSDAQSAIVLVDSTPLPEELRRLTVAYEVGWPSEEELEEVVRRTYQKVRRQTRQPVSGQLSKRDAEQLVQTLRGLTCEQAERVVAEAILHDHELSGDDLPRAVEAKKRLLGAAGSLEAIAVDVGIDEVMGLARLKQWLAERRNGSTQAAREFGLTPPRGMLMLGVPGCGKSLCAKAVAADWKLPLMRLDPGVLYQKFVGETEAQLRRALAQAEAMAPAVLWIDEIEKAFASAAAESADGGLSKRMFGTLLSWMQDHRRPIFMIATANDVQALPPELLRKGRFDEVFFIDLPGPQVRAEILAVHLARRKRDPKAFDLPRLARAAEQFSGSELEQAVVGALFRAFSRQVSLTDEHLLEEIRQTRPLAILAAERIERLRAWATDRCVPAD